MAGAVEIVGGPSKWDLMMSAFEGGKVSFELVDGSIDLYVRAISNERHYRMLAMIQLAERYATELPKFGDFQLAGCWLIEGVDVELAKSPKAMRRDVVYAMYSLRQRRGVLRRIEVDTRISEPRQDMLRLAWIDLLWGNKNWRNYWSE